MRWLNVFMRGASRIFYPEGLEMNCRAQDRPRKTDVKAIRDCWKNAGNYMRLAVRYMDED